MRIIYNTESGAEHPLNRQDDAPVEGLQPPLVVLEVIEDQPVPAPGFFLDPAPTVYDLANGMALRQWTAVAIEQPEQALDYEGFYTSVLNSTTYQQVLVPMVLSGSSVQLTGTMAIFGFAIQDAMAGRIAANEPGSPNSLQSAIWLLMGVAAGQLSAENMAELQGLLESSGLSAGYALLPPQP
jgi:hypothetical protein